MQRNFMAYSHMYRTYEYMICDEKAPERLQDTISSFPLIIAWVDTVFFYSLGCLRADVSYFLYCTRKRDVCVTPSLIVFQRPAGRLFYFA